MSNHAPASGTRACHVDAGGFANRIEQAMTVAMNMPVMATTAAIVELDVAGRERLENEEASPERR